MAALRPQLPTNPVLPVRLRGDAANQHGRSRARRHPDRRRDGASVEWLPAHGGLPVWSCVSAVGDDGGCRTGLARVRRAPKNDDRPSAGTSTRWSNLLGSLLILVTAEPARGSRPPRSPVCLEPTRRGGLRQTRVQRQIDKSAPIRPAKQPLKHRCLPSPQRTAGPRSVVTRPNNAPLFDC